MSAELLADKVVVVTGAGRGFGAGIAHGCARAGARVVLVDINAEELGQTQREIAVPDGQLMANVADVADFGHMQSAIDHIVEQWGRLDVLINNAAILPAITFVETTATLWKRIIDVNLTGVYNGVRAVWPHMVRQGGGHCISIASGASVRGFHGEVAYCASKHGLEGFTKALAIEGEPFHIAVNTMGPGKRIKPTSVTRADSASVPQAKQSEWTDPVKLAPAFVWLALQPPARYSGLRFDAGPIADTVAAEGYDFAVTPQKVTLYVNDFVNRLQERRSWTTLPHYASSPTDAV